MSKDIASAQSGLPSLPKNDLRSDPLAPFKKTYVVLRFFDWWVDNAGCGQAPLDEPWPKTDAPIIYAHFRIKPAEKNSRPRYHNGPPKKIGPRMLAYIGERKRVANFRTGPKHYKWLLEQPEFRGSWMYSLYWELVDPEFRGDSLRKTLEALVYYDVMQRHYTNSKVLAKNCGMQFSRERMTDSKLLICKFEILRDLSIIGI